ncbi:MAG: hypothetical protein Q8L14_39445 [Myxococcales bacterium]|nr:hypothetical protein [Myxococcales bacterium]
MNRTLAPLLTLLLAASGCAYNRVALGPLPSQDAPLPVRVKAFKKYAIQNGQQTTYLRNGVPQNTHLDFVLLGDGTRVEDPRDLAPAVESDSATGRFITKLEADMASAKKASTILALTSVALIGVGLGIGLPLLLGRSCSYVPGTRGSSGYENCYAPNAGLGAVVVAAGAGLGYIGLNIWPFLAFAAERGNQQDRASAFMMYNQSLRERLALDDESLEQERDAKSRPVGPSALLIPAATLWLAHLTR